MTQSMFAAIFAAMLPLAALAGPSPVRLIIDTDMSTDCDDVAAVCIANTLHQRGEVGRSSPCFNRSSPLSPLQVELLAVVHNTGLNNGIGAVSVLNTFYNHSSIPMGAFMGSFDDTLSSSYVSDLVDHFPTTVHNRSQVGPGTLGSLSHCVHPLF